VFGQECGSASRLMARLEPSKNARCREVLYSEYKLATHGEDWAPGMGDHLMRSGALEMSRRAEAAGGVANAQDDQICVALFGCFEDAGGGVAVLDDDFGRRVELDVFGDDIVELMDGLGDGQIDSLLIVARITLRDDVHQKEARVVFLSERNGVGRRGIRLGREIGGEQDFMEARAAVKTDANMRSDGKNRNR